MKSFDEYLKEDKSNVYPSARQAYKAGQRSKQAEVDELQKRIDIALDHAVNHGGYDDLTHIINILKGDQS